MAIVWQDTPPRPAEGAEPAWPHDGKPLLGSWEHAGETVARVIVWDQYQKRFVQIPGFHEAPVTKIAALTMPEA